jgi:predicted ATP-dependent endonuclease of OLD family
MLAGVLHARAVDKLTNAQPQADGLSSVPHSCMLMADSPQTASAGATQPPYLKHVHLRNVPPLRDVTADFKPGLNVIIGKNGSGKTQFLKLVRELADPYLRHYTGNGCSLTLSINDHTVVINFEEQPELEVENNAFGYMGMRTPLLVSTTNETQIKKNEILKNALDQLLKRVVPYRIVPVWHGVPTNRLLPIIDASSDLILTDEELKLSGISRWSIDSWLLRSIFSTIERAYRQHTEGHRDIDRIKKLVKEVVNAHIDALNSLLPIYSPLQGVRCNDEFKVYASTENGEMIVKGLEFEYEIGGDWLPFSALSDGTKRVFYVIGEIASLTIIPASPIIGGFIVLKGASIFLLEEPELGIHPKQLHLLLQLIREVSREHQVIMTTHSPQTLDILNKDELDRITICEYVPGKGTQMRKLSAAKKKKAKAYLRDNGFLSEFWRFSNLEDPD